MDKALFFIALAGLCFIAFALGGASLHYKGPGSQFLLDAFAGIEGWKTAAKEEESQQLIDQINDDNKKPVERSEVKWDKALAENGYTLITVFSQPKVYLVDMDGKVVHTWTVKPEKILGDSEQDEKSRSRISITYAWLFPNGDLLSLHTIRGATPYGRALARQDKDSNIIWVSKEEGHHQFYVDGENGNIYKLTHHYLKKNHPRPAGLPDPMLTDNVVIMSSEGKTLDTIPLLEAFVGTPFEMMLQNTPADKPVWDHFHTNSVIKLEPSMATSFPMFKAGQLLLSIRNMNLLAVLDPVTRKIVWAKYGPWRAQHNAQFLANGRLLLFDNLGPGLGAETFSRVIEVDPVTTAITWHYSGSPETPLFTSTFGSVQRLKNGNTLINETNNGRLIEVTPEGKIVWEYVLPGKRIGDMSPVSIKTALRYTPDEVPFIGTFQGEPGHPAP